MQNVQLAYREEQHYDLSAARQSLTYWTRFANKYWGTARYKVKMENSTPPHNHSGKWIFPAAASSPGVHRDTVLDGGNHDKKQCSGFMVTTPRSPVRMKSTFRESLAKTVMKSVRSFSFLSREVNGLIYGAVFFSVLVLPFTRQC